MSKLNKLIDLVLLCIIFSSVSLFIIEFLLYLNFSLWNGLVLITKIHAKNLILCGNSSIIIWISYLVIFALLFLNLIWIWLDISRLFLSIWLLSIVHWTLSCTIKEVIIKLFELAQSWTLACISSFASSLQVVDRECCTWPILTLPLCHSLNFTPTFQLIM